MQNLEHDLNVHAPRELCPTPAAQNSMLPSLLKTVQVSYPAAKMVATSAAGGPRVIRGRDRTAALRFDPVTRSLHHR